LSHIHIRRVHHSTLAEAKKIADRVAARLAQDYDLRSGWQGNTLHFSRSGVSGSLAVSAREFAIDVRLGLLMAAFKGPIQQAIESNLDKLLAPRESAATRSNSGQAIAGETAPNSAADRKPRAPARSKTSGS